MTKEIKFNKVKIKDHFWSPKLTQWKKELIRTCLDKCYESGRIDNFKKAAGLMSGDFEGIYFNDSDVYKVLEGAAYFLQLENDPELEAEIDQIIEYIVGAQEADGYLDTYYTLEEPENKWTDMERHEMYCGGHLIEAAIAYYQATGKKSLLEVAEKMVAHYLSVFGQGKRSWVEGHQEIELALLKLYQVTKNEAYLEFSEWLLDQRGRGLGKGMIWNKSDWGPAYCQDDVPIKEISHAVGHSVRAMYMYTAMAEIFRMTKDEDYLEPLKEVWKDITETKMYLTGGIGSSRQNEGFKESYFLPNDSAYAETCAAIGQVFFNHQMNLITGQSTYADIIERCLYNGVLSGISQDSKKFFYVNPLASIGNHHRSEWFGTSCCPTNLARFLPSIGNYIFSEDGDTLVINQFIGSEFEKGNGRILMGSALPWGDEVKVKLVGDLPYKKLNIRKPSWAKTCVVTKDESNVVSVVNDNGYIEIDCESKQDFEIRIKFENTVRQIFTNKKVVNNHGKVAIEKGPLVYCVEETDNLDFYYDELLVEEGLQYVSEWEDSLDCYSLTINQKNKLKLIPYYTWDNRESGYMKVWLDKEHSDSLYYSV